MNNYVVYHLHSDLSNAVTNIDSTTKYHQYIERAKALGMKALAFSEHGSVFEWWHKKMAVEAAGMKYIHAVEAYLTADLTEKVRDNYHCVLIAKNYEGFLELNKMISKSFNRNDNHFYYAPRISFEELFATSDNIIMTTACVGGVLGKGNEDVQQKFIEFLIKNKHRSFLEIGHHRDEKQLVYNRKLVEIGERTGIPLIAGTDTHVLNDEHETGRIILQRSKNIFFEGEENWDLKFKSIEELLEAYRVQNSLPEEVYLEAIENTNKLAEMVDEFELDRGTKYPHIYKDPEKTFKEKAMNAIHRHPYALKFHNELELKEKIEEEFEVYKKTESIDFMLMQTYLREWEEENGIQSGYGRGSVSGSMIAYLLGITQMDSMRFGLNFFRFMNPSRVTNADIDTDYSGKDRDRVKQFLLRDKMNLPSVRSAEIVTFNTIALKGAIRDVCRALYKGRDDIDYYKTGDDICKEVELHEDKMRKLYPEVFRYADIVNGTIVSIGTHPSGVLVSDLPIDETVGLCSISTTDYPVSMINMKELDDLMYVKLDILGLDNIGVINETCRMLGIERLTPDNTDLEDMDVWKGIRNNTTLIFQWESNSAQQYMKRFMSDRTLEIAKSKIPNFSMLKWMSFGNGLLRPACASFRDSVAAGEFYDNGFDALNEFLSPEAGRIAMQETIMQFLVKFCGYSAAESDTVRRAIAKKKGTETLLPEIEKRFINFCGSEYDMTHEQCEEIIKPFLQIILDASAYGFSWNHSDAYSAIGYICGYLRHYHPLEFLTASLNIFGDNQEKTAAITQYASKVGIKITAPKFGYSKGDYFFNKKDNVIAKGLRSIKYMSDIIADELFELSQKNAYGRFSDLLYDIKHSTSVDSRQLEYLIKIDYFSDFGNQRELLSLCDIFERFKFGTAKKVKRDEIDGTPYEEIVKRHSTWINKNGQEAKSYTLNDVMAVIREAEDRLFTLGIQDLPLTFKARNFMEIMGYAGYISGQEKDRNKLYITGVYPVRRKKDNEIFGYSILTQSLGSGKESRMTVFKKVYENDPIKEGDIIVCKQWRRDGAYFQMTRYEHYYDI